MANRPPGRVWNAQNHQTVLRRSPTGCFGSGEGAAAPQGAAASSRAGRRRRELDPSPPPRPSPSRRPSRQPHLCHAAPAASPIRAPLFRINASFDAAAPPQNELPMTAIMLEAADPDHTASIPFGCRSDPAIAAPARANKLCCSLGIQERALGASIHMGKPYVPPLPRRLSTRGSSITCGQDYMTRIFFHLLTRALACAPALSTADAN